MKAFALLLSTLTLAAATIEWDDLVVTWRAPTSDPERLNSFFQIPRTRRDAVSAGWVNAHVKQSLKVTTYCMPDDPRFCIMINSANHIAGVQIGTLVSDVEYMQSVYSMARINYHQIKTIFNQQVWTSVAWTQNPADLKSGRNSRTWNNLTGTEGVWFETKNGRYEEIPRNLTDLDPMWTEQACVPTMGTHYYYDMYNTTACENMTPWFLLFQNQTLTAVGHLVFGTSSEPNRTWNDVIPEPDGIRMAAPNGPQCLYDAPTKYGFTSRHVYFTAKPWTITSCA